MIFTTTRELLLDYASALVFLRDERPPSDAVDLVNVGVPEVLSMGYKDPSWCGRTYDESIANSSSHSEGFALVEE